MKRSRRHDLIESARVQAIKDADLRPKRFPFLRLVGKAIVLVAAAAVAGATALGLSYYIHHL